MPHRTIVPLLISILFVSVLVAGAQLPASAANPPPVQLFYLPFPEDQLLQGLQAIEFSGSGVVPTDPVWVYISIAAIANNTLVYYDKWENGYDPDIANPTNIYSPGNPGGTQIWGNQNILDGAPPGVVINAGDVVNAGTVIVLNNPVTSTAPVDTDFSARDKIAATKTISIDHTGWATGPNTLLAGSVEVYDTHNWGLDHRAPVGEDIPDATDFQMFEYTALYIMAGPGGANVQIDADANGVFEAAVTLLEGEGYFVNGGVNVGGRVLSDHPVQVDILTGDIGSSYESRDSALLPLSHWFDECITPVSTASSAQGLSGTDTTVWLYNPGASAVTVTYERRVSGTLTTSAIVVPGGAAGGYAKQLIPDGTGVHFHTATGEMIYAFSTTDSNSGNASGAGNQAWDWGYTLVPRSSLTPQVLIGLGIGRDPTSLVSPTEDGNPIWVTPIGNGETPVTVYVDFDANSGTGPLIDPNGNHYNVAYSLKELERAKVYDTIDGDQTGMLLYILTPGIRLAAAWGQDPLAASPGEPGLDVGAGAPPAPSFDAGKNGTLYTDVNGDGFVSPGDELLFTIVINNTSRAPVPDVLLQDNLPVGTAYVPNTTFYTNAFGITTQIPDNLIGTAFPLDGAGVVLDPILALPIGSSYTVTFRVTIDDPLPPGVTEIVNEGLVKAVGEEEPITDVTPIYGRIGDWVWIDTNDNGLQDPGEPGLNGVMVELLDTLGNVLASTTTADNGTGDPGYYLFSGLLAGNYIVRFTAPTGFAFTIQDADGQGIDGTKNSKANPTTGETPVIPLATGQTRLTIDAGLLGAAIRVVKSVGTSASGPWDDADTPPGPSIPAGSNVFFQYVITNAGDLPLTGVTLTDSVYNAGSTPPFVPTPPIPDPLGPGATYTYVYGPVAATVGQHTNTATTTGTPPSGPPVTDNNPANYYGEQVPVTLLQAYCGSSCGSLNGIDHGFGGITGDVISSVPGIFAFDPGGPNWTNFVPAFGIVDYMVTNSLLRKAVPTYVCTANIGGQPVVQQGFANITKWWPLMYELPGTTWTLTINYTTASPFDDDGPGPHAPSLNHVQVWTWSAGATLQSMKDLLELFHELPLGHHQVPLISDEPLYTVLQAKLDNIIALVDAHQDAEASLALDEFILEVEDACIAVAPPKPIASGAGTGIANTCDNPACCKILADADWVAVQLGLRDP